MKLHILFGQRKCRYQGEYAPEALDVADEFTMDENAEWLDDRIKKHKANSDFTHVGVLIVKVADEAIYRAIGVTPVVVTGEPTQ